MPKDAKTDYSKLEAKFYACGHQTSNAPCSICQPNQPEQPDDWHQHIKAGDGSLQDKVGGLP